MSLCRILSLGLEVKLEWVLEDLVVMLEVILVERLLLSRSFTMARNLFLSSKTVHSSCSNSCFFVVECFSFIYNSSLAEDFIASFIFRSILVWI